jgi:sensor histidine kinase regulating citrate/malate metabolism
MPLLCTPLLMRSGNVIGLVAVIETKLELKDCRSSTKKCLFSHEKQLLLCLCISLRGASYLCSVE